MSSCQLAYISKKRGNCVYRRAVAAFAPVSTVTGFVRFQPHHIGGHLCSQRLQVFDNSRRHGICCSRLSLGILPRVDELVVLVLAVILLAAQGWIINRLAGVPVPLWSPRREPLVVRPGGMSG